VVEHTESAAVDGCGCDDVRVAPAQRQQHGGDGRHARGERLCGDVAVGSVRLECGDTQCERVDGGVVDAAVGVAGFDVTEHVGVVLRRLELEGRRAVRRQSDRDLRGRIRPWGVHGAGALAVVLA